ncbi:MAG: LacI family DNA-binding transcriptional regulator [Bacteroidetes bacterium]|nr:LacI family DNA-binding transcriptional regulator [Bacteroidota bacterium]
MKKKITLTEVAASLGISKTVVSLVVNGKAEKHGISRETRRRVEEKIKEFNYTPNQLARGFRTGRTHTIGLIVSDISNLFYAHLARHIEDLAWSQGFTLITCSTDENEEKELRQMELLLDRKVDGLIISSTLHDTSRFDRMLEQRKAHVLIDRVFAGMQSAAVSVDNFGGGTLAAQHLLEQGAERPVVFSLEPEHISSLRQRAEGFLAGMGQKQGATPVGIFLAPFDKLEQAVEEKIQEYHRQQNMPDAIFALNNNIATYCLKHLQRLNYRLPEQVMLVGFDDAPWFSFESSSLTVIAQPVAQIAQRAFDLLMQQIPDGNLPMPVHEVLPVELVVRHSTSRKQMVGQSVS